MIPVLTLEPVGLVLTTKVFVRWLQSVESVTVIHGWK